MPLDPNRWTLKTQEAVAAAIDLARQRHNPEVTPEHLLAALLSQEDGVVQPTLARAGVPAPGLRSRTEAALGRLAQAEVAEKGKRAGIGIGMFSGAGLMAFYGLGTLIATLVLALALALPSWLAALIVTVVLFAIAAVLGLVGKKKVDEATPLKPERAVQGVQADIATVKGHRA